MKTTFILNKTMLEKGLKNLKLPLHIILFNLFLSTFPKVVQDVIGQPTIEWDRTIGGENSDWLQSTIPAPDGGYLLAGSSSSNVSGDKSEELKGICNSYYCDTDYWIVKIDAQGNKVWDKTIGGASNDYLSRVIPTSEGGFLLAGSSVSNASGDKSENSKGFSDYWIVKIDAQGNKVWDKTLGGRWRDNLSSAISTPDGGYLLAGSSDSNATGDKSENSKGQNDYWIVKIDAQGNKVWDKTFGGYPVSEVSNVISTPDGGYLLAGSSDSNATGDKSENSKGGFDYWIVKIDARGNKHWDKTIGGSGGDWLSSAISTPDGGYLLVGNSTSGASGDKSEELKGECGPNYCDTDYWIVKIDAQGNKIWDKTIGGSGYDELHSTITTPDGGYLLAGASGSNSSGDKSENNTGIGLDYWVVKVNSIGNKIWDKTIGGSGYDFLKSAISTSDGSYLLAGNSSSDASGNKSENSKGGDDYWIVKLKDDITPIVMGLSLIDAKTNQEIRELHDEDVIYLAEIGTQWLNIRANIFTQIDHVKLELQGPITHTQTEEEFPYTLFGDYPTGDFKGKEWVPGNYTLTATPYTKDEEGIALSVSFEVTDTFTITGFTLINATLDQAEDELFANDIIDLREWKDKEFNIRVNTFPEKINHVKFDLKGPIQYTQIEREPPYALFGDNQGDFNGKKMLPGNYNLTATPFSKEKIGNTQTISFQVEDFVVVEPTVEIEWDKAFEGEFDILRSAIPTPDGGYLLAGYSDVSNGATYDYWIIKIDAEGSKIWEKVIGGNKDDFFRSITPTPDGGYLLAGYSNSPVSGDKSEDSEGRSDYWIVKIDSLGNKVWDKTFGGSNADLLQSITLTNDEGFLLAGYSYSPASGDKSEDGKGNWDYWIVKTDANGNKLWDKTIGGNGADLLHSTTLTSDGGILLAGHSDSPASGDKSENKKGGDCDQFEICDPDYWVVKIDTNGNIEWEKTLGGSSTEEVYSVTPTLDGGYLVAGHSDSPASGDKSENSKGETDYWVIKIDVQGNKVWDKTIGGSNNDKLRSTTLTSDGGYLLAGSSSSGATGNKSEDSKGGDDYWIVKIDANGNKIWDKTIGGNSTDDLRSIIPTPDGGYLLAGSSSSGATGDKTEGNGSDLGLPDYWVVKLKDKSIQEIISLTLINAETGQEIRQLKVGDVIYLAEVGHGLMNIRATIFSEKPYRIVFELNGPITHTQTEEEFPYALFGDYPTGDYKGRKWLTGKYTITATPYAHDKKGSALTINFEVTDAPEANSLRVEVYPVPASDRINILHEGKTDQAQLILMDFGGNVLLQQPLQQQPMEQLDLSGFTKGIYFLKVISPEAVQVFRIAKE